MLEYLDLYWTFVRIGGSMFGGGYALVSVIDREIIKKKGWIDMTEVMDYYTIGQITPGISTVNVSTFVGYKRKGPLGGIMATLGVVSPGILLMIIISIFIKRFAEYEVVQHAFAGIRIAVCATILDTLVKLIKSGLRTVSSVVIFLLTFALSAVLRASPVYVILGAGLAGFLLYKPKKGQEPANANNEEGRGS